MIAALRNAISRVAESAESVNLASSQLAAAANQAGMLPIKSPPLSNKSLKAPLNNPNQSLAPLPS
jgi:hypothetical protein